MEQFKTKESLRKQIAKWHRDGLSVGLVPTMGALHEGHLSLMRLVLRNSDRVVVSIFVNPTQFGPNEDFAKYPREESSDLAKCNSVGVHAVFTPTPEEMYGTSATVSLVESKLSKVMCGVTRPHHFGGVLTVVSKLFNIVQPDVAVFGQKDAQQLAIIKRMVRDLDFPIRIIGAPIVREPDGLAKSSRNMYLTNEERGKALCLRESLDIAEKAYASGNTDAAAVIGRMRDHIDDVPGTGIDYITAVDADSLEPVTTLRSNTLVAMAVYLGKTRLIDNTIL